MRKYLNLNKAVITTMSEKNKKKFSYKYINDNINSNNSNGIKLSFRNLHYLSFDQSNHAKY